MNGIELLSTLVLDGAAVAATASFWWYITMLEREAIEEELFKTGVNIILERGFQPETIIVKAGPRVRLNFTRRDSSDCGALMIPAFGQRLQLPLNRMVTVEITPARPGKYDFTCESNSWTGKLIVESS